MLESMDVVNKLLEVFRSLKSKGEDGSKKKTGAIIALVIGAVAAVIIAILSFRAWKTGKKMAKLLHEKAVNEEKFIQAEVDKKIAVSEEAKQAAAALIEEIHHKIVEINEALEEAETIYDQAKDTIHEIKTWDEFDKLRG